MSEPRTHYQISMTARQAVGLFVGLLLALGLAFFFGLMTGYSGRESHAAESASDARVLSEKGVPPGSEPLPPVETGVPSGSQGFSKTEASTLTPAPEPTTPSTLHPFEDSAEEEAAVTPAPGSRTSIVGGATPGPAEKAVPSGKAAAPPAGGKVWIQAASLSSHDEAAALGARLSRHGFHAVVLPVAGPKGRVYRVRVGPYRSENEASRAMATLTKQEKIRQPWIVPDGK